MGWAYIGLDKWGREAGYGIAATCDRRRCDAVINRGLGCCCGPMHNGDEGGCGRYYCDTHLGYVGPRGGCEHRGKRAWGETFCQLLFNDGRPYAIDEFWCACGKWLLTVPAEANTYSLDRWREVPGYLDHLATSKLVTDMQELGEEPLPGKIASIAQPDYAYDASGKAIGRVIGWAGDVPVIDPHA